MANTKISALSTATPLTGSEVLPVVQDGVTKKVTTDQFLIKDASGNVGLGVTPSAWRSGASALQVGATGFASLNEQANGSTSLNFGCYESGANTWSYFATGIAPTRYTQLSGAHSWYTAPNGTAGNTISFTQAMTLDAAGNLDLGALTSTAGIFTIHKASGYEPTVILNQAGVGAAKLYVPAGASALAFGVYNSGSINEVGRFDSSGSLLVGTAVAVGSGVRSAFHSAHASGAVTEIYASNSSYGGNALLIYANSATTDSSFNVINYYNTGNGTTRFTVRDSGNVQNTNNSYGAYSDLKLKENIADASPKLAKLMQVRIVNYNLKSDPDKTKLIGVVAQELEQVSPGLIEETADFEDVKKTREVTKSVPVTEQVTVQREQKTVEVVDGKAVVTVTLVDEQTAVPVVDQYPLFDADGQPVLEVDTPEVPEVLDEDGNVTQPAVPATYRQATHSVPRMMDVTETEEYTERVPLGTVTKSVKYSVFVPMLVKAVQEQQGQIVSMQAQIDAQNEAMQLLANRLAALEAA